VRRLTVLPGNTTLILTAQPSWNVTQGTQTNVSCQANNNEVLMRLYRNAIEVASGYTLISDVQTLPQGQYNYTCNTTGSQNWSAASISNILYVGTLPVGEVHLYLNGIEGSITINYSTSNATATTPYGYVTLYRDSLVVANGSSPQSEIITLAPGIYNYTAVSSGDINHSQASVTYFLTVNRASSLVNLTLNGIDDNTTVNPNENVTIVGRLIVPWFFRRVPPVNQSLIDSIGSGEYGVDSMSGEEIVVDSSRIPQGLYHIELYLDNVMINSGDYVLTNITSFNTSGIHNATVIYPGTQNYSSSYETHWIIVNQTIINNPPVVNLILPLNGSVFNTNNITFTYNVTDDQTLLLNCTHWHNITGWRADQSQMTLNATSNSFNVTNIPDGTYIWNVECNDGMLSAFAPMNWTFTVNITQPDLTPPEVWNVSAMPNIINQSDSTMLEAYARDNQSGIDTVLARVTYPNNATIDYRMQPGMIQYQYLYNFTDTAQVGTYNVRIIANDTQGNVNNTETTSFVVQTVVGYGNTTTIITQPQDNAIFNLSQVFLTEANVSAINGDVLGCNATITFSNNTVLTTPQPVNVLGNINNGTTFVTRWNVTAAAVGTSDIIVTTTCQQGGSSFDTAYNITVATNVTAPIITILSPQNITYNTTTIALNVTADQPISTWLYSLNSAMNVSFVPNTTITAVPGLNNIIVYGNNSANMFGSDQEWFTVNVTGNDTEPPVIIFVAPTPANNTVQNWTYVYVNTTITDNVAVSSAILDWNGANFSMPNIGSNYYLNVTGLADGLYIYKVYANDTSNNWNVSETRYVTVNTTGPVNNPPVVTLISPLNGTVFTVNNVTTMYNVTDDQTLLLNCDIYSNTSGLWQSDGSQVTVNGTSNLWNYTGLANGAYLWNVQCSDGLLASFAPQNWTFVVNVSGPIVRHDVGIDDSYSNSINGIRISYNGTPIMANPANLTQGQVYELRARVNNYGTQPETVNNTYYLVNSTNRYVLYTEQVNVNVFTYPTYNWNVTGYANGQYNITLNTTIVGFPDENLSDNDRNRTINIVQNISDLTPPWYLNISVMPPSPQNYSSTQLYQFNITWQDNVAVGAVWFEFDGANYTPTCVPGLPVNDTVCSNNFTGLGAGTHSYRWYARDTSNNYNQTGLMIYIINPAQTILTLTALPGWNVQNGTQTNVSCTANNNEVTLRLYRDSTLVSNPDIQTLPIGNYNYTCNNTASQNYTAASASNILIVSPLAVGDVRLWLNGTEGNLTVTYNNESLKFNASTLYGNVSIRRNGTLIAGPNASYTETYNNLPSGFYNFTAYSTGDATHQPATVTYFLTIGKANSSLTLYLNGTNGDMTISEGQSVNHTAVLNMPSAGTLSLLRNGTLFASGLSPLTNISIYNNFGYYNITAVFAGDQNYTNSSATHFITVLPAVHDISVDSLELLKDVNGVNRTVNNSNTYLNDDLFVNSNISNLGNVNENNVNVTLEDNSVVRSWQIVSLNVGETKQVNFTLYNIAPKDWHTVRVRALPVLGELNLTNNQQSQDVRVWSVCDVIDCTIFRPITNQSNYTLGTPFIVRAPLQNLWATQDFHDLKIRLSTTGGLVILTPDTQFIDLAPGEFKIAYWTVNSTSIGNKTLTTWAGNNEYSKQGYVQII